ncbi:diguanylate cyclase [Sphingomonas jejuensis]|uniref:diguanylate cyclase n=1 Tax=Sphingomonas jejuensis TaxID=904715 RepID=A0ABX0XHU3_9SPHN|nr:GGDEF domain-containing protein [Sphingomonas jejuensis]NJC32800.1 diguanylate cyclase [Sphingomonas jejuensis]
MRELKQGGADRVATHPDAIAQLGERQVVVDGGRHDRRAGSDDARRRTGRLANAMRNLLGMDDDEDDVPQVSPQSEPAPAPAASAGSARQLHERIGAFLFGNGLDPTPDHYDLAYQYVLGANRRLVAAVDRAIEREGLLSDDTAELILEECRTDMSADALARLVDEAQAGLTNIAGLVRQSGADAEAYGQALESGATAFAGDRPDQTIEQLLSLTRSMIDKTRDAQQQLRTTGKRMGSLRANLAEARRIATSDVLTGLPNRRAFENKLKQAIADARAGGRPLSLAFCDIDHFKKINDTHGHDVGDRILKFVAKLLSAASGNTCHVARHGGEEFVMLFEGRTASEAWDAVEACRADLASRRLVAKQSGDPIGQVSFSAGVAALSPDVAGRDLLRMADRALYRAKNAGRNQVLLADHTD